MWKMENLEEFIECIGDLISSPRVLEMGKVPQHVDVSCLNHCIFVAYISFLVCRKFRWDFTAAARGGLLHDLFLYDWRVKGTHEGLHGFSHPAAALRNASELCELSAREKDIILKHMWPLTLRKVPRYRESFVVSGADKACALMEIFHIYHAMKVDARLIPAVSEANG